MSSAGSPAGAGHQLLLDPRSEQKAMAKAGIPRDPDPTQPLPKRLLRSKLAWLTVVMLLVYLVLLLLMYQQLVPDREVTGGTVVGLGTEAIPLAAKYAALTVVPLSLVFLWADRFRPQRFWVWLMTFGWGACVATFISLQVNSWAAGHLSIVGDGDPATAARAAIYVAPFVEESSKATVLFWLAILMRYQWVSRLSGVVLAGLSAAAFAFVENIVYYGRAYRYAARTYGEVSPTEALQGIFFQRGVVTCFAHPLFTAMTGIGLAIALRSKSKVVRVVAPLAGFVAAAFLHMAFNATVSLVGGAQLLLMYFAVALPLVAMLVLFTVRQIFREGRLIRERLIDYVRVGWLQPDDPKLLSRLRTRARCLWQAVFLGPYAFLDTIRMQRTMTELAYLRDAIARGLVDSAGLAREKVLLARARELRGRAVIAPAARANYPALRREPVPVLYSPPQYPGPAGIGGNFPAPNTPATSFPAPVFTGAASAGSVPLGQTATQYSEVDPSWKPPEG